MNIDHIDSCFGDFYVESIALCILAAKYEQANIHVAFNQQHLMLDQHHDLFNILSWHKKYSMDL